MDVALFVVVVDVALFVVVVDVAFSEFDRRNFVDRVEDIDAVVGRSFDDVPDALFEEGAVDD